MSEVRDVNADRREALEQKIAAVEKAGGDATELKALLKGEGKAGARKSTPLAETVRQPMPPGTAVPGVPLSPEPVGQPEPNDGSAPDKRRQDNSPRREVQSGIEVVAGPVDPGPEAKVSKLPDSLPAKVVDEVDAKAQKTRGKLPDQTAEVLETKEAKTAEELQKEAAAKDRRKVRDEAAPASDAVDANPEAPIVPDTIVEQEGDGSVKEVDTKDSALPAKKAPAKKAAPSAGTSSRSK